MPQDYYGYDRQISQNGTVMTSEMAVITIEGMSMTLAQSITGSYRQTVNPSYEIGSPNMAFVAGQPIGDLNITRLCSGKEGFLAQFNGVEGSGCGSLLSVTLSPRSSCPSATVGGKRLRWSSCMANGVTVSANVGGLQVTESVTLLCGMMGKM